MMFGLRAAKGLPSNKNVATEVSRRIRELHSYDTVEIVVLEVDVPRSDPDYVAWVRGLTGPSFSS